MGLSFLSPVLLGGAALVSVPILLHLLMRQKPVRHTFPALRFLQARAVANRRRLRLQHLLLLALRTAAIALFALALARPVVRGAGWLGGREGPAAVAFVFDTAPRMLLREGNRTRLEQATALARTLFARLPASSSVAVIDTAGGAAAFSPSPAAAAARMERLAAAVPAQPLRRAVDDALALLAGSELKRRELYVFTDCSHGAWDDMPPLSVAETHPDTSLLVVDVGAASARNFAIDSLGLSAERIPAGAPLGISVTTRRSGTDAERAVAVDMIGPDGRPVRRALKPGGWRADGGQVEFEIAGLEPGIRQGRVVIDGTDDLEADDAAFFTVDVAGAARVLVAAPAPAERSAMFVTQAIAPKALARAGKGAFDVKVVETAAFDDSPWDDYSGIVLVDPGPLPERTWELLGQWVAAGRGLVVWLGPRAGDAGRFNSAASRRVLGGDIVRVWRTAGGDNYIAPAALDHPILAAFRRVGDAVPWQDFPVTRHWEFEASPPADGAATADLVAPYRNGLPAIVEHRLGRGTVVTVTTPVSQAADDPDAWNSLATGFEPWPFVMLANETLLRAIDSGDRLNVPAGRPAVMHVARRDLQAAFVRTPAGDEFPAAIDAARGTVTVTATQLPGNYLVRGGGDVGGVATGFSANAPAAALDFSRLAPDALATALGPGHRLARTEDELVRDVNLERVGAELFGWVILLAALAMAADWIAANRFYAPRVSAAEQPRPAEEFAGAAAVQPAAEEGPPAGRGGRRRSKRRAAATADAATPAPDAATSTADLADAEEAGA